MLISAITPASRGVKDLDHLIRDFKNQLLPKNLWEHVIVWDGEVPDDVRNFIKMHEHDYNLKFTSMDKDSGDMKIAPGTRPRNRGTEIAEGDFVCYCDDDDRFRDSYLSTFAGNLQPDSVVVVQMSCQESRMAHQGDPTRIRLIPEIGLPGFPICCHVGTPCFLCSRAWALEDPWQHEPEHDYRFIKRICEKHNPLIRIIPGMQVDVDGLVIGSLKDWVSMPPFYRGD